MQQTHWAPRTGGIVGCAVAGVLLGAAAVPLTADLPGRILTGLAALGLIVFAGVSWRARPKLAIGPDGLMVRDWGRPRLLPRMSIKTVRIAEFRRIGRRTRLLEIETLDGRLVILSRWDLGTEPLDVLAALIAAGYTNR